MAGPPLLGAASGGVDPDADKALEPVLYALAASYGLLGAYAVWKLFLLHRATRTWTRQKLLHYLVLLCAAGA
jgi:hypothetical protein